MYRKKVMAISSAVLLSGIVAGCGSSSTSSPSTSQSGAPGKTTYSVLYDFNVDPKGMSLTDNKYVQYLKSQTGVTIQLNSPGSAGYMDKLNVMMASGDYPDAFQVYDKNSVLQFASQGLLTDLTPYVKDSAKYPNMQNVSQQAWLPVTQDGKIWAFPYEREDAFSQLVYINKDWLAKLNLQVPKTIDDFYNVIRAFALNDPDGNGQKDTFGLLANNTLNSGQFFQAAFDANTYKIMNGKVTPPEITDNYKNYLKFMQKLVQEKILDPEFPTTTTAIFEDKIKSGKYGMFQGFWHFPSGLEIPKDVMQHYIAIAPPLQQNGSPSKISYPSVNRHYIAIPKTNQNIDSFIKFIDWAYSNDGTKFNYLGIPDKEYKVVNGKITTEGMEQTFSTQWMFSLVKQGHLDDNVKNYLNVTYGDTAVSNLSLANQNGQLDKLAALLPFNPDPTTLNLPKIVQEYTFKAVLGNTDIDQTWNSYVQNYLNSGGQKNIDFWTNWYNTTGKNLINTN